MNQSTHTRASDLHYLFSPEAVRQSSIKMYEYAVAGNTNFIVDESLLSETAKLVIELIESKYPDLDIPYHSRWRHFDIPKVGLLNDLKALLLDLDQEEKAKAGVDLIVVSVLLDAGAGEKWRYAVPNSDVTIGRSEGLGLASLNMFLEGGFSDSNANPLIANAAALSKITVNELAAFFQVSSDNPLVGLEGRVELLKSLGAAMKANPEMFPTQRPGDLVTYLQKQHGNTLDAKDVLAAVILGFGNIWPGRTTYQGTNLGDVWHYAPFGEGVDGLVCLHKLSQWLTYSVIETLQTNGFTVNNLDGLTGLAEYRNGGLFVDTGVLTLREINKAKSLHKPDSNLIIEWRALTVYLLDRLAEIIRHKFGKSPEEMPLVKILEGGTWLAGRRIAAQLREGSTAPILLDSDGTVF